MSIAVAPSKWTKAHLMHYLIEVKPVDQRTFFRGKLEQASADHIPPELLDCDFDSTTVISRDLPQAVQEFFSTIRLVQRTQLESAVDRLIQLWMEMTGFKEGTIGLYTRIPVDLLMCGTRTTSDIDVALMNGATFLFFLCVVADKVLDEPRDDPEAQVVAEAIAAFQHNNRKRKMMGLRAMEKWTVSCMTIRATEPEFYLVEVTRELSDAVMLGHTPGRATIVERCRASWRWASDGEQRGGGLEARIHRRPLCTMLRAFQLLERELRAPVIQGLDDFGIVIEVGGDELEVSGSEEVEAGEMHG